MRIAHYANRSWRSLRDAPTDVHAAPAATTNDYAIQYSTVWEGDNRRYCRTTTMSATIETRFVGMLQWYVEIRFGLITYPRTAYAGYEHSAHPFRWHLRTEHRAVPIRTASSFHCDRAIRRYRLPSCISLGVHGFLSGKLKPRTRPAHVDIIEGKLQMALLN